MAFSLWRLMKMHIDKDADMHAQAGHRMRRQQPMSEVTKRTNTNENVQELAGCGLTHRHAILYKVTINEPYPYAHI